MRPTKLTVSAFGPYADLVEIDMDKLGESGIYLITGDTGAGKTTIFDAISFALFGEPSGHIREAKMFRSLYAKPETPTFVELEFLYNQKAYKIRRNPDYMRPRLRGNQDEFVSQKADAQIWCDGSLVVSRGAEANAYIENLIGLNNSQFKQIAMLAQGDFLKIIIGEAKDRKEIFRKLFKTENYEKFQKKVEDDERNKKNDLNSYTRDIQNYRKDLDFDEESGLAEKALLVKQDKTSTKEAIDVLGQLVDEDENKLGEIRKAIEAQEKKYEEYKKLQNECIERDGNNRLLEEKSKEKNLSLAKISELAEKLKQIDEKMNSRKGIDDEIIIIKNLLPKYELLSESQETYSTKVTELSKTKKMVDDLESSVTQTETAIAQADETLLKLAGIDEQLVSVTEEKGVWNRKEDKCEIELADIREVLKLCQLLKNDLASLDLARQSFDTAKKTYEDAKTEYDSAYNLYLAEQAGILAETLVEGQKCPVCGSTTHPMKAVCSEKAPTKDELEILKSNMERKSDALNKRSAELGNKNAICEKDKTDILEKAKKYGEFDSTDKVQEVLSDKLAKAQEELKNIEVCIKKLSETEKDIRGRIEDKKKLEAKRQQLTNDLSDFKEKREEKRKLAEVLEVNITNTKETIDNLHKELQYESKEAAENYIRDQEREKLLLEKEKDSTNNSLEEQKQKGAKLEGEIQTLVKRIETAPKDELSKLNEIIETLAEECNANERAERNIDLRISKNRNIKKNISEIFKNSQALEQELSWLTDICNVIRGSVTGQAKMDLETYVQASYFERVIRRANSRFLVMSDNQYELVRRDRATDNRSRSGLELDVIDHNNAATRDIRTLSGGESFMASLCLALGLSEEVQSSSGGIVLDTMFVDEGFGSLDEDTLNLAMKSLKNLSEGNRLVGVISHVAELKNRIDKQIVVKKDDDGSHVEIVCENN